MIDPHAFPSASQPLPAATPHHPPQTRLTPRLITPVALAFAALLATTPSTRAAQIDIPGPTGSGTFGKTVTYLPNGNFVVSICLSLCFIGARGALAADICPSQGLPSRRALVS